MQSKGSQEVIDPGNKSKNFYIHKIKSLAKNSNPTLSQKELDLLTTSNRNRSKQFLEKESSTNELNELRLQKNKLAAKKARQRKKIYLELLQKELQQLQRLEKQCKTYECFGENFIKDIKKSANHKPYFDIFIDIGQFMYSKSDDSMEATIEPTIEVKSQQNQQLLDYMEEELADLNTFPVHTEQEIRAKLIKEAKQNEGYVSQGQVEAIEQEMLEIQAETIQESSQLAKSRNKMRSVLKRSREHCAAYYATKMQKDCMIEDSLADASVANQVENCEGQRRSKEWLQLLKKGVSHRKWVYPYHHFQGLERKLSVPNPSQHLLKKALRTIVKLSVFWASIQQS